MEDSPVCGFFLYSISNIRKKTQAGELKYWGTMLLQVLLACVCKSRSTIYLPWDWLATPPRLEIKKTIDASFCGGAKMVSTVRTNVILGV